MEKIYRYFGLAKRGGNLVSGYNTCISKINDKKIQLLVIASDAANNTQKKFIGLAEKEGIPYRVWGNKMNLGHAIGIMEASILGVTDEKFSEVMICELDSVKL
ncbi:MAG: ribosomal L7Ae/L30e/S12e/Gadd45 family protein [Peptostreptococcales bacterium]